jgi:hypothetical protein
MSFSFVEGNFSPRHDQPFLQFVFQIHGDTLEPFDTRVVLRHEHRVRVPFGFAREVAAVRAHATRSSEMYSAHTFQHQQSSIMQLEFIVAGQPRTPTNRSRTLPLLRHNHPSPRLETRLHERRLRFENFLRQRVPIHLLLISQDQGLHLRTYLATRRGATQQLSLHINYARSRNRW